MLAAGTISDAADEVGGAEGIASDGDGRAVPEGAPKRFEVLGELREGGVAGVASAVSGVGDNSETKTDGSSDGADKTGAGGLAAAGADSVAAEAGLSGNALAPRGTGRAEAEAAETTVATGVASPASTALRTDGSSEDESNPAGSPVQEVARNSGGGTVVGTAGAGGVAARETTESSVEAAAELAARRRRPESPAAKPTSLLVDFGWSGATVGPGGTVVAAAAVGEVAGPDEAAVLVETAGAGSAAAGDFGPAGRK